MAQKPTLAEAIKEGLTAKNIGLADCALQLGFSTESFRVRLSRNSFNAPIALKIAEYLGWSEDIKSLQKKYTFKLTRRFNGPQRQNQIQTSFLPESISEQALSNLLPLIRAIAASDVELVNYEEFMKLLQIQGSLNKVLTPDLVKSLLHALRTPES